MPTLKRKDSGGAFPPIKLKREDPGGAFNVMVLKRLNSAGNWEVMTRRYIDNWERGDLTPYTVGGESATKDFKVTQDSARANQGDWFGHVDFNSNAGGGSIYAYSMPGDGLQNYPVEGETSTWWTWFDNADALSEFSYGLQNKTDAYPPGYKCWIRSGEFALRYTDSGGSHAMATATFSQSSYTNEYLRVEVYWAPAGSDHVATLYDSAGNQVVQISGQNFSDETDYTSGGTGWRGGRTTSGAVNVRLDNSYINPE